MKMQNEKVKLLLGDSGKAEREATDKLLKETTEIANTF